MGLWRSKREEKRSKGLGEEAENEGYGEDDEGGDKSFAGFGVNPVGSGGESGPFAGFSGGLMGGKKSADFHMGRGLEQVFGEKKRKKTGFRK
jgi:hypothetical protein